MRPAESENLSVSTQEKDGQVTVVVNALDKASEYLNFLRLRGSLIRPDMTTEQIDFRQTEAGKYEAQFPAEQAGSYFLRMGYRQPDGSEGFVSTGLTVSYPPEYRDLESNRELLENVVLVAGGQEGAGAGRVIEWDQVASTDFFPHDQAPTLRLQDGWPILLLVALSVFLFDVGVRRIAIEPKDLTAWSARAWRWLWRRPAEAALNETMERLRSRKAEVNHELKERRFDVDPDLKGAPSVLAESDTATTGAGKAG